MHVKPYQLILKWVLCVESVFRTADENNSIVILDEKGAETLPNIKGRAILRDGEKNIIQVPHMTYEKAEEILNPYKKEIKINDNPHQESDKRPTNQEAATKIQNLFSQSDSENFIQSEQQPDKRVQPNHETINNGWFRFASKEGKR
jgi:hypothetical protein